MINNLSQIIHSDDTTVDCLICVISFLLPKIPFAIICVTIITLAYDLTATASTICFDSISPLCT